MRAELEFDTPDPLVRLVFHDIAQWLPKPATVMNISGLPFAFAKELQKRWNAYEEKI
jgi:hypothetical protein